MLSSSSYNFLRASLSSSSYFANAVINIVVVVLVFLLLTLYILGKREGRVMAYVEY